MNVTLVVTSHVQVAAMNINGIVIDLQN